MSTVDTFDLISNIYTTGLMTSTGTFNLMSIIDTFIETFDLMYIIDTFDIYIQL